MALRAAFAGIKYFFKRRATVKYPDQKLDLPEVYRGRHIHHIDKCISCGLCARSCPSDAIEMVALEGKDEKKKHPQIDYGKCIFCGLCVDACPSNALEHTSFYHLSTREPASLVLSPIELTKIPEHVSRSGEPIEDQEPQQND